MIIAIFGGSGCGKTTLARIATDKLGIPVRHCGEQISDAVAARGHNLASAPDHLHQLLDRQTRDWCAEINGDGVVEGRFLDRVLADLPGVVFVEFTATRKERARRLSERLKRHVDEDEVCAIDEQDDLFRRRMYPDNTCASRAQIIDTGRGTALECGQKLISMIAHLRAAVRG
jgi:cytidylate kinase